MVLNFTMNFVRKMFSNLKWIDSELKTKPKTFDTQNQLAMHFRALLDIQVFFWIFFFISSI
jgi:hypothetical protein